jgi:hypothetical protein
VSFVAISLCVASHPLPPPPFFFFFFFFILSGMHDLEMADLEEQHINIKFCFKLGKMHQKYRRQNLGLVLGCRNQMAVLSVKKPIVSMSSESTASQVKHKERVGGLV